MDNEAVFGKQENKHLFRVIFLGCISKFSVIGTFITAWLAIHFFSTRASKWVVIQLIELTSYHRLELSCQRSAYTNAFPVNPISQSSAERIITFIWGKMTSLLRCEPCFENHHGSSGKADQRWFALLVALSVKFSAILPSHSQPPPQKGTGKEQSKSHCSLW